MTHNYFIRRILHSIPVLFGVTLITFLIFNVAGGDPALQLAGRNATPEQIESIRHELGLDRSLPLQYLHFVNQIFTFDWGESWFTHENINKMILSGIGPSLSLTAPAFLLSITFSIAIALFSVFSRGTKTGLESGITIVCLALMSISFLVYIIVFQYLFAFKLDLFPINGWEEGLLARWKYLVLPWIISIIVSLGPSILIFRSAIIDEIMQDYVRTAKAKGVQSRDLYFKHILKNAMVPISTVIVLQIPFLMTGSLLLEAFFGIPGLGGLLISSIQNADFPVVKAFTVIGSILYLLFIFLLIFYTLFLIQG